MKDLLPLSAYLGQSRFSPTIFLIGGALLGPGIGLAMDFSAWDSGPSPANRARG